MKITASEYESTDFSLLKGSQFRPTIMNTVVLCEDYPSSPTHLLEPVHVPCIWRKVIIVDVYLNARQTEYCSDFLLS